MPTSGTAPFTTPVPGVGNHNLKRILRKGRQTW